MSIATWYGPQHVLMAVTRAAALHAVDAAATSRWTDAFEPAQIPRKPTAYTGPFGAIPSNGGYYLRAAAAPDTARPLPYAEFFLDGQDLSLASDAEADLWRLRIGVRVTIGSVSSASLPAPVGTAILESQALAVCRLVSVVAADYLRGTALALNVDAFGVCWAEIATPPAPDLTSPQLPTAAGVAAMSAVSYIHVYQRQFAPAGLGQTATNP